MPTTLDELKTMAWDDLRSEYEREDWEDATHEVADSMVPVYAYDLMYLLAGNVRLAATPISKEWFGDDISAVNVANILIYEEIYSYLQERIACQS